MTKTRKPYLTKAVSLLLVLVMMMSILPMTEIVANSATADLAEVSANTASQADDIVSVALAEKEGYYGNNNKYTHWYGKIEGSYSYAWCATFVSWCADQAGISTKIIKKTAGCRFMASQFDDQGVLYSPKKYTPVKGDIVFFTNGRSKYSHVGIVLAYDKSKTKSLKTVEGNTGDGTHSSGCLKVKWRDPNYSGFKVSAYAHPKYKGTTTYSVVANNATNVSNNSATIKSIINVNGKQGSAKVQKWGYFIGTNENEVRKVDGETNPDKTHKDTKTMDWHRFIDDNDNPKSRDSASYTVTGMFDTNKALQPDTLYYYKFCVKINGKWHDSNVKSFRTAKTKPDTTTLTISSAYSNIGLYKAGVTASWKAAKGAEKYSLQLLNSSGQPINGKIVTDIKGTTATCPSSWFSEIGTYSVRLIAINSIGSTYSNTQQIEVHPNVFVTFKDSVTDSVITKKEIHYGESADTPQIPAQKGHTFKQWSGKYTNVTQDETVYAEYTLNVYTVKFIDGLTGDIIGQPVKVEYGKAATAPTVESRGAYVFTGWDKDFSCVEEDMIVTANYKWFDDDFPVSLNITENPRQDKKTEDGLDITGYYVTVSVEAWDKASVQGRVIVALKSENGLLLASTESEAFSVKPGSDNKKTLEVFVPYSKLAYRASVYAVNEYDRSGIISDVNSRDGALVNYTIDNSNSWLETTDPDEIPEGAVVESYEAPNYVTQTLYRYRDKQTTTSYDTSLSGWTRDGNGEWINQGQQTLEYVPSFHSGFDTGNSLYKKYNKSPKSAYENATEKLVIDHTDHKSYIYWHWCEGKSASSPGNHYIGWNKSSTYKKFHAFESTTKKEYKGTDYNAYVYKKSDCCSYNYNWNGRSSKQDKLTEVKKQYYTIYKKRFNYYKWTDWSSWSTTQVSASSNREVETKPETDVSGYTTVYKYRMADLADEPVIDTEKQIVDINGKVDAKYIGKRGTIIVYKHSQPSDFTNEFINGVVIESATDENGNEYGAVNLTGARLKEAPSIVTGDFTIAVAVAGNSEAIILGTIEAPKPTYMVRYFDFDGNVIDTYENVTEGTTIEEPNGNELTAPEGYRFVRWDTSAVNIQRDMDIYPMSEKESYAVVFVDWASQNVVLERHEYGEEFSLPPYEEQDGMIVSWNTEDLREVADADNPDVVSYTAYKDAIVTTHYEEAEYDLRFIDRDSPLVDDIELPDLPEDEPEEDTPEDVHSEDEEEIGSTGYDGEVSDDNITESKKAIGGASVELPYEDEELEGYVFMGWRNINTGKVFDGNDIKESGTYCPIYEFADTVATPTASITTGEYNTAQTVTLSCDTDTAVIYYSTDGTDPATGEVNENEDDPSGVHKYISPITLDKSTDLLFCAMAMGMNNSDTVIELYAINTATSGVKQHIVSVYSNLPETEGAVFQKRVMDSTRFTTTEFGEEPGYTYEGLFYDAEGEDEFYVSDLIVSETVLFAVYTPKTYTATFKDYDGTTISTVTADFGTAAIAPTPTREGYVFIGWDSDDYEYLTEDKTFVAQYCLESEYATVSLTKTAFSVEEGSDPRVLKAKVTPAELSDAELEWETSNPDVVSVDQNGLLEFLSEGTAIISVTVVANGESAECVVTVLPNQDLSLYLRNGSILDIDSQGYLRRIPVGANSVTEIKPNFANDTSKLFFFDTNSNALSDTSLVGTGSVIKLMDGDTVLDQITAVMTGDFNGDGIVNTRDVSMMSQNVLQLRDASEIQAIAVDVNGDGDVNVRDCAMMSRYLAGKEVLE